MVVRYHLFTGGYKETSFSLVGLSAAIKTAFDIDVDVDPAALEQDRQLRAAISARLKACFSEYQGRPDLEPCRARTLACAKSSKAATEFNGCIAGQ